MGSTANVKEFLPCSWPSNEVRFFHIQNYLSNFELNRQSKTTAMI